MSPDVTDVPKEFGWPEPTRENRGVGYRMMYEVTADQAEEIADHLTRQAGMLRDVDRYSKAQARSLDIDASRIRWSLKEAKATR